MEKQEIPKDYVVKTFDEFTEEVYKSASFLERILYRMQDHVILVTFSSLVIGYLAGIYFGMFW